MDGKTREFLKMSLSSHYLIIFGYSYSILLTEICLSPIPLVTTFVIRLCFTNSNLPHLVAAFSGIHSIFRFIHYSIKLCGSFEKNI